MALRLHPEEPVAGPWQVQPLARLLEVLSSAAGSPARRPRVVAVDGRGGSGKTTLTARLARAVPGSAVVHTDDIAWAHSRFGWDDLMADHVLGALHEGRAVRYQPPAWARHGREGHVEVPVDASMVFVEGVDASRRELSDLLDAAVWVQSDWVDAERRGILRDGGSADAVERWHAWQTEEIPFLAADQPWARADVVVAGASEIPHDAVAEVVMAPVLRLLNGG